MFEIFTTHPNMSAIALLLWGFVLGVIFWIQRGCESESDWKKLSLFDNLYECSFFSILYGISVLFVASWFTIFPFSLGENGLIEKFNVQAFLTIVFIWNALVNLVCIFPFLIKGAWKKYGATRYEKYRNGYKAQKERNEIIGRVEKIFERSYLPPNASAELGKALKEWALLEQEKPSIEKKVVRHQAALEGVKKLLAKAEALAKDTTDPDLRASYEVTAADLQSQCDELQKLIDERASQAAEKSQRTEELLTFFKQVPGKAEELNTYDDFTAEALKVQKKVKNSLLN
jgi:hypothetical protein